MKQNRETYLFVLFVVLIFIFGYIMGLQSQTTRIADLREDNADMTLLLARATLVIEDLRGKLDAVMDAIQRLMEQEEDIRKFNEGVTD